MLALRHSVLALVATVIKRLGVHLMIPSASVVCWMILDAKHVKGT